MKLIEFNQINKTVRDKIKSKIDGFSPNSYMFFTDDNNNYIGISRNQSKNIAMLKKKDPINIKNSTIIVSTTDSIDDMFEKNTIENCFIYSSEFNMTGECQLFNSNIIAKYELFIKDSFIFKSDIVSGSDLTISQSVITNLILKSPLLVIIFSCNIQDSTIKSDSKITLHNYKIITSEINKSILKKDSITPVSIENCKIENSFINFDKREDNNIKNKNLSNDVIYDNIDITSEFTQFVNDIFNIISKKSSNNETYKVLFYKKNNMIVAKESFFNDSMIITEYVMSNTLKNIFNGDVINLNFNPPFKIDKVKLSELFEFFLENNNVIPFANRLMKFNGKSYFYNMKFIKEYKGIFKPTVKQSFVIESDENNDEYNIFVVNTDVYAINVYKKFTEKMNAFLIGRFTSPLDSEHILFMEDSLMLSEILDLLQANDIFFSSLDVILKGKFNFVKNDMYDSNNDSTIVFNDGQINLVDANFLSIISENNYNTDIISFYNIKNQNDYKKFITYMGEYNKKGVRWKSEFIKGLTFSHNYNYFLTEQYIFIIWDVNPETITIIESR